MKNFNYILTCLILVLLFVKFKSCEPKEIEVKEVYIKGKTDTVYFEHEKIIYKEVKPIEIETDPKDSLRVFTTDFSDSLADIIVTSRVKGLLYNSDIEFTPKYPKFISRVDTLIKFNQEEKRLKFFIGAEIGGNSKSFVIQPGIIIKTKTDNYFTFGYEFIQGTYNAGFYAPIFKPPK